MKACSKCGEEKPFSQFPQKPRIDNKTYYQSSCRSCINRAAREKRERLKNDYIAPDSEIKRSNGFVFVFSPKLNQEQKREKLAWNGILRLLA